MMANQAKWAGVVLALVSGTAHAQTASGSAPGPNSQGDVSVTIYNNDLALIEDQRRIDPGRGDVAIELPDVSAAIQPETVSLTVPDATILEQNFDYDLLSPARLLDKAVGQQVTLVHTNPTTGADSGEPARVLANNGGTLLDVGGKIEILGDMSRSRLVFPGLPPGLKARPTLSVRLDSSRGGTRPVTLSYLSHGFSWKADYVALFDDSNGKDGAGKIDVQGWITLNNTTGTNFANAHVLLVAGEVANSLGNNGNTQFQRYPRRMPQMTDAGTETSGRERLGDFYVYPIAGRTTLANAQQKQVSFLDVKGASAHKIYRFANAWLQSSASPASAQSVIAFSTGAKDGQGMGIGDALPAGMVRVYMRDARGQPQFIGEQSIGHTPMGSTLALPTGDAFDVKVQPTLVKRAKIDLGEWDSALRWRVTTAGRAAPVTTIESAVVHWQTTMQYRVTNARPTPVTVEVSQSGLDNGWSDTRVPSESQPGTQRSIDERVWQVAVPANGETTLTVTYDTRY